MTVLLDSSSLIAVVAPDHVHRRAAEEWLTPLTERFATCPLTEGAAVRVACQRGYAPSGAFGARRLVAQHDQHEFWPDDIGYADVRFEGVTGHRQVTDACLAQPARDHGERVATLDRAFGEWHADVAVLVPVEG